MNRQYQQKELEKLKKQLVRKILTKKAAERLGRVRVANKEFAERAEIYLLQLYQAGKLEERSVNDSKMKEILRKLSRKKKTKIRRK